MPIANRAYGTRYHKFMAVATRPAIPPASAIPIGIAKLLIIRERKHCKALDGNAAKESADVPFKQTDWNCAWQFAQESTGKIQTCRPYNRNQSHNGTGGNFIKHKSGSRGIYHQHVPVSTGMLQTPQVTCIHADESGHKEVAQE